MAHEWTPNLQPRFCPKSPRRSLMSVKMTFWSDDKALLWSVLRKGLTNLKTIVSRFQLSSWSSQYSTWPSRPHPWRSLHSMLSISLVVPSFQHAQQHFSLPIWDICLSSFTSVSALAKISISFTVNTDWVHLVIAPLRTLARQVVYFPFPLFLLTVIFCNTWRCMNVRKSLGCFSLYSPVLPSHWSLWYNFVAKMKGWSSINVVRIKLRTKLT